MEKIETSFSLPVEKTDRPSSLPPVDTKTSFCLPVEKTEGSTIMQKAEGSSILLENTEDQMRGHVESVRSSTMKTSRHVDVEGIKDSKKTSKTTRQSKGEDRALEGTTTTQRALKSENLSIPQEIKRTAKSKYTGRTQTSKRTTAGTRQSWNQGRTMES